MADDPVPYRVDFDPRLDHQHDNEAVAMDLVGDMVIKDPGSRHVSGTYRCRLCGTTVTLDVLAAVAPIVPGEGDGPAPFEWTVPGGRD